MAKQRDKQRSEQFKKHQVLYKNSENRVFATPNLQVAWYQFKMRSHETKLCEWIRLIDSFFVL